MGFDQYGFGTNAGYGTSNNGGYGGYGLNGGLGFSNAPYYHPGMDPNGLQADAFQKANGQQKGNPITGFFKGMAQGAVNTIKGLFTPQGIIMTAAGAGLIWATGGLAVLPLAAIGAGVGGYQMLKGAANGSAEGVGEGFFTAAASVLGAKFTPKSVKVGGAKFTLQGKNGKGGFMDSVKALFGKRQYKPDNNGKELNMYQLSTEKTKARFGKAQESHTSLETSLTEETNLNTAANKNISSEATAQNQQARSVLKDSGKKTVTWDPEIPEQKPRLPKLTDRNLKKHTGTDKSKKSTNAGSEASFDTTKAVRGEKLHHRRKIEKPSQKQTSGGAQGHSTSFSRRPEGSNGILRLRKKTNSSKEETVQPKNKSSATSTDGLSQEEIKLHIKKNQ